MEEVAVSFLLIRTLEEWLVLFLKECGERVEKPPLHSQEHETIEDDQ